MRSFEGGSLAASPLLVRRRSQAEAAAQAPRTLFFAEQVRVLPNTTKHTVVEQDYERLGLVSIWSCMRALN